eukprot:TRINITY_DN2914_c0_g1_i1.p1 TRINITY_DN2914_c0_g1~~TRINITY_DN2914_c0_g1_i1.p1  ORF type:complete len:217 (+),score=44.77 TRINITY_DN2914_c0_g1_i1:320-970(+)
MTECETVECSAIAWNPTGGNDGVQCYIRVGECTVGSALDPQFGQNPETWAWRGGVTIYCRPGGGQEHICPQTMCDSAVDIESDTCVNLAWTDSVGASCYEYYMNNWCAISDIYAVNGVGASDACCFCGGGTQDQEFCDIIVSGVEGEAAEINGNFKFSGTYLWMPYYYDESEWPNGMYLYYLGNYRGWFFADDLGSTSVYGYVLDDALVPNLVQSQ